MSVRILVSAALLVGCAWNLPASASPLCSAIFSPHPQIAKEIEIYSTARLLSFLDTKDGQLITPVPQESRDELVKRLGDHVLTISWKNATDDERQAVVETIAPTVDFAQDRKIPGLQAPRTLQIKPAEDFVFRGRSYLKGVPTTADLTGFLLPLVEYAGGGFVKDAGALEFHFRGQSPSKLDREVRIFFSKVLAAADSNSHDGLSSPASDHLHIVARKPVKFVRKMRSSGISDRGIARALTSYHALVELGMILASRTAGVHKLAEIKNGEKNPPLFSFLKKERIGELNKFYQAVVDGQNLEINKYSETGTALKKNLAGARWGSAYSDQNLWGIELRFPGDAASKASVPLAEGIKTTLDAQDFRISIGRVKQLDAMTNEEFESTLWFSTSAADNAVAIRDPQTKTLAKEALVKIQGAEPLTWSFLGNSYVSHKTLAFFDWSSHPLLAGRPADQFKSRNAQLRLFQSIISKGSFEEADLDHFFKESGWMDLIDDVIIRTPRFGQTNHTSILINEPAVSNRLSFFDRRAGLEPNPI